MVYCLILPKSRLPKKEKHNFKKMLDKVMVMFYNTLVANPKTVGGVFAVSLSPAEVKRVKL